MLDADDNEIGTLQEDSMAKALLRKYLLGNLMPQSFHLGDADDNHLAEFRTHFNPFVHRMTVTVHETDPLSPMMILAGGVLLMVIEGRQKG